METRNFREMLERQWADGKFVCVGLDVVYDRIPKVVINNSRGCGNAMVNFCLEIVEATKEFACAYKPNSAFFEAYGNVGWQALARIIENIHLLAPGKPVIWDAKRGDIGNTNNGYVKAAFEFLEADAITVQPYLGAEAMKPFLDMKDKGIIVLCRTSNPGAGEFQDLLVNGEPFYRYVARNVASEKWNKYNNCAVVVGATYPDELREARTLVGDMPILIPGIGAQGGDVEKTVTAGKDSRGQGMIINSSRGIIYASSGEDFAEAAGRETEKLHKLINQYR